MLEGIEYLRVKFVYFVKINMSLVHLLPSTINRLTSTQIITSVSSAVKELMENALDAGATNVDVKLGNNGLDRIEVKDDGCGIKKTDIGNMCLSNYTSKICDYSDLEKLQSYGFRGEALNALCGVADVTITTRTSEDEFAMAYTFNNAGNVVSTKPSHFGKGTSVTVNGLFRNLPVRKQYLNSGRRAAEDLKKTDSVIKSLAIIHPDVRVTLCHNKCLLWQKSSCTTLRQSVMQVLGHFISNKLEELMLREPELTVNMMVPRKEMENLTTICTSNIDCMMLYINSRPVRYKKLEKVVLKYVGECFKGQLQTHKYPYCLISVTTSPAEMDVNLEPNKTRVLLKEEDEVLSKIEGLLASYYEVRNDMPQPVNVQDVTETSKHESNLSELFSTQHSSSLSRNKTITEEKEGRECKRLKVNSEVIISLKSNEIPSSTICNSTVTMTQLGKERFLNGTGTGLQNNVSYEVTSVAHGSLRTLAAFSSIERETVPDNESLTTNASEMADDGCTVTKNSCLLNNRDISDIREINDIRTHIDSTACVYKNSNEQNVYRHSDGILNCNSSSHVMSVAEVNSSSKSAVIPCSTNTSGSLVSDSTLVPNTNASEDVMKDSHVNRATIGNQVPSVISKVKNSYDVDLLFNSDLREEIEFCAPSDNSVVTLPNNAGDTVTSKPSDSVAKDSEIFDINSHAHLTSGPVSKTSDAVNILPSAVGEDVWEACDSGMEKWSKGQLKAPNDKMIQGSSVLLPKVAAAPKSIETLDYSCFSVSSQMGRKEQSAFTKFAREERPKILQEFPLLAFTKVAEVLVDRWKALSDEERTRYEEIAKEMDKKRKCNISNIRKRIEKSDEKLTKIKNFFNQHSKKEQKKIWQKHRKKEPLDVSLEELEGNVTQIQKEISVDYVGLSLIGQLRPSGTWLYKRDTELGVIRHWGLQEAVLYHRLMTDHCVPLKKLDSSILIDERTLDPSQWKTLLSLKKTYDVVTNSVIITSDVISKNGFRIEVLEGSGRTACMLTDVASTVNFYGIKDLKDVLELIKINGSSSLVKCRSLRVSSYIREEAVRIVQNCPAILEADALQDLIRYWNSNRSHLGETCLHSKPIFCKIKDLSEVE